MPWVLLLPSHHLEPPAGLCGPNKETSAPKRQCRNGSAADLGAGDVVGRARGSQLLLTLHAAGVCRQVCLRAVGETRGSAACASHAMKM